MAENKRGGNFRGGFKPRRGRRKVCLFCAEKDLQPDYKDVATLRKFVAESGKILPRRMSGTCAKHQRAVTTAIKLSLIHI